MIRKKMRILIAEIKKIMYYNKQVYVNRICVKNVIDIQNGGLIRMFRYEGARCAVCGEKLNDGEDIVVWPECGAPQHRDCGKKNGKCGSSDMHGQGVWPFAKETEETVEEEDFEYVSLDDYSGFDDDDDEDDDDEDDDF